MKIYKSYGFWTALAGAVVVLLNAIGRCCGFAVEEQLITDIIMAIAGVLVVFGVVTMPKKNDKPTEQEGVEGKDDSDVDAEIVLESEENKNEFDNKNNECENQIATEEKPKKNKKN